MALLGPLMALLGLLMALRGPLMALLGPLMALRGPLMALRGPAQWPSRPPLEALELFQAAGGRVGFNALKAGAVAAAMHGLSLPAPLSDTVTNAPSGS